LIIKKNFANVESQIGYCGIWCGSCVAGNGVLRDLSARYEKLIRDYAVKEWAPKNFDFDEFLKGVASLKEIWLCPGCIQGGGQDNCEIRSCAKNKNLAECSECIETQNCGPKEKLETMRSGSKNAGLVVKTDKGDAVEQIQKWKQEMKFRWPDLLLFLDE
jgi:hypothetical protein